MLWKKYRTYLTSLMGLVVLSAIFLADLTGGYLTNLIIILMVYIVLASSWSIIHAYLGEFSFGHVVFFGVGQYAVVVLQLQGIFLQRHVNVLLAGGVAALLAAVVAYPILRIRGWYFAIGTFALSEIVRTLVLANPSITRGAGGFFVRAVGPYDPAPDYFTALILGFGAVIIIHRMVNSRFGLALRAIRDSYDAARMIGLAPTLYRSAAFVISASLAGLAGGYFVQYSQYADPFSAFSGALTFKMVFMSMVGGSYWIAGPVVGAAVILILEEIGRMLFLRGSLLLMTVWSS
jgi:branched-chain amino acid transport system permease protein